jgi:hypothetical protein
MKAKFAPDIWVLTLVKAILAVLYSALRTVVFGFAKESFLMATIVVLSEFSPVLKNISIG